MLKRERLQNILDIIAQRNIVTVAELADVIAVSEMTIRRDLDELDRIGKVARIHGGAQSIASQQLNEMSHNQKREINIEEKNQVATLAVENVKPHETIFVGPGTTLEFMCAKLYQEDIRIVTNSLPVFEACKSNPNNYDIILIGGTHRKQSGAFVGSLANQMLEHLTFDKTFVGVNGIYNSGMMTSNLEEGRTQGIALNRAAQKYVVADYHKLNRNDFYEFYTLYDIDGLFTNPTLPKDVAKHYAQYTKIITEISPDK